MKRMYRTAKGVTLGIGLLTMLSCSMVRAQEPSKPTPDSYDANNRKPDDRFKADILLVVAHPDDEVMVTAYLARQIYDHHMRVAVVYGTRGEGSVNEVGPEQSTAMGDIREIEGRKAVGSLGITNVWFLPGHDTASQNVLQSLERWGHGTSLDRLVRIVRITRPSVILTWLPVFVTGENHGDHQAAGVLATEAFDMAGDPTAFPEQISPARDPHQNMNLTEALRPWQPQKLFYFANPAQNDFFAGQGPEYSSKEISPARKVSYGRLAAESLTSHMTQGGGDAKRALAQNTLDGLEHPIPFMQPVRLIMGKSLLHSAMTDDVFQGVVVDGIPYQRAVATMAERPSAPVLEIGDPWSYYSTFWQVHGLDHLPGMVPPEISVTPGSDMSIPLIVDNPLDKSIEVTFSTHAPDGWKIKPVAPITVGPHTRYYVHVQTVAPPTKLPGWQNFSISAESENKELGTISFRSELTDWAFSGIL